MLIDNRPALYERLAQRVRRTLEEQVEGFTSTVGDNEDLLAAGVRSLDLLVVLSNLEHEFDITLDDVVVAKGHTIGSLALRICDGLSPTSAS